MNIQEFYDSIDEDYENVSNRMMGNQKLVEKFVRKSGIYTFAAQKCKSSRYDPCRTAWRSITGDQWNWERISKSYRTDPEIGLNWINKKKLLEKQKGTNDYAKQNKKYIF